jgi:hypothetical protein
MTFLDQINRGLIARDANMKVGDIIKIVGYVVKKHYKNGREEILGYNPAYPEDKDPDPLLLVAPFSKKPNTYFEFDIVNLQTGLTSSIHLQAEDMVEVLA